MHSLHFQGTSSPKTFLLPAIAAARFVILFLQLLPPLHLLNFNLLRLAISASQLRITQTGQLAPVLQRAICCCWLFSLCADRSHGDSVSREMTERVGTRCYMAPEVFQQKAYSLSADVYAIGR
jgi:serine/threonine protein kinase